MSPKLVLWIQRPFDLHFLFLIDSALVEHKYFDTQVFRPALRGQVLGLVTRISPLFLKVRQSRCGDDAPGLL
jgi:hypothetical protein